MGHESFDRGENVVHTSDRSVGLVFAVFFAVVWAYPSIFGAGGPLWALIASAAFLLVALVAPALLGPLNRLWTRFGLVVHKIVSPIVLGIMFFLVVTPTGLIMRALGKDPLRLKRDPQSASYWIERVPPGPGPESLEHLF
jgi:Saxitoxin biosynthesis operon protein SxtJ